MINNILEFSKSEALTGKVTTADVDIGAVIAEIIADNEHTISARNLKIEYDQKEVTVKTDKEIFKQALSNLIGNAVIHSKEGTTVEIRCDKNSIEIINTANEKIDDIKSIREPFVKGSDSRGNNGSGLGLAIADNNLAMLRYKLELKTEGDKFYAVVKL
jgi:signal transduction histidine kinase